MTDPHDKRHKHDKHHDEHIKHAEKGSSMRPAQSSEERFHASAKMAATETRNLRTNSGKGQQNNSPTHGKNVPAMHGSTTPETLDRFGTPSQMKNDSRQADKSSKWTTKSGKQGRGRG